MKRDTSKSQGSLLKYSWMQPLVTDTVCRLPRRLSNILFLERPPPAQIWEMWWSLCGACDSLTSTVRTTTWSDKQPQRSPLRKTTFNAKNICILLCYWSY